MKKAYLIQIIIRILLIIINMVVVFFLFFNFFLIGTFGFSLVLILQFFLFINYFNAVINDIENSIDCLLFEDYSTKFSSNKKKNPLFKKIELLAEKQKKKNLLSSSEMIVFTNIIESLPFGMLIVRKDYLGIIEVFQINRLFAEYLNVPKYNRWNLLKKKIGQLQNFVVEWKEIKQTITISINQKKESFFLKTSFTKTNSHEYLTISLETIQQLIDKKEKESWYKLMNVMSHEIINTITPISSLAENLSSLINDGKPEETFDEVYTGLSIIKKRSEALTIFVDNYRKLAELPKTQKSNLNLTELIKNVLVLFDSDFKRKNIKIEFTSSDDYYLIADKSQIEQVMINLLSNAIHTVYKCKQKLITILIEQKECRTHIYVRDNGIGISNKIKDKIFIPYYTTRKDGAGIGLTLSKSIIEAHKGSIYFVSNNYFTEFQITLA